MVSQIQFVCSDMWKAFLTVLGAEVKQAMHVLDRFHIV
ncbi:MAG: transposase, partial [Acidobacteria bacterium]|nr:transposase [Acidobacteriota bacterium]